VGGAWTLMPTIERYTWSVTAPAPTPAWWLQAVFPFPFFVPPAII
jgi:hypothetical protein